MCVWRQRNACAWVPLLRRAKGWLLPAAPEGHSVPRRPEPEFAENPRRFRGQAIHRCCKEGAAAVRTATGTTLDLSLLFLSLALVFAFAVAFLLRDPLFSSSMPRILFWTSIFVCSWTFVPPCHGPCELSQKQAPFRLAGLGEIRGVKLRKTNYNYSHDSKSQGKGRLQRMVSKRHEDSSSDESGNGYTLYLLYILVCICMYVHACGQCGSVLPAYL